MSANMARAAILSPFFLAIKMITFVIFTTYVLNGYSLDSEKVFLTLGLIGPVRLVMALFLPFAITSIAESKVTVRRVQVGLRSLVDKGHLECNFEVKLLTWPVT